MADVPKDDSGDIYAEGIILGQSNTVTTEDSVTTSTAVPIAIADDTKLVVLSVLDAPVFVSYSGLASSTEYDIHLIDEKRYQLVPPPGEHISHLSFIGDGATAKIRVVQYK